MFKSISVRTFTTLGFLVTVFLFLCMLTATHAAGKVTLIPQTPSIYEGSAQQLEVKLSQPIICPTLPDGEVCEVTLDLSSSDPSRLSISPSSVSYLANEWSQTRVVTVEATIDGIYAPDTPITITATAEGTAPFLYKFHFYYIYYC